jgi:hypothetical protein
MIDEKALEKAILEGVKQFQQQMDLGGGNLTEMFTRVVQTYEAARTDTPTTAKETK